jgi:hypothetical protein
VCLLRSKRQRARNLFLKKLLIGGKENFPPRGREEREEERDFEFFFKTPRKLTLSLSSERETESESEEERQTRSYLMLVVLLLIAMERRTRCLLVDGWSIHYIFSCFFMMCLCLKRVAFGTKMKW